MNKLIILAFVAMAVVSANAAPQMQVSACTMWQMWTNNCPALTTTTTTTKKPATTKKTTTTTTTTTTQPPPPAEEEPAEEEPAEEEPAEEEPAEEEPAEEEPAEEEPAEEEPAAEEETTKAQAQMHIVPLGSLIAPGIFGAAPGGAAAAPAQGDGQAKLEVVPLYEYMRRPNPLFG